MSPFPRRSRHRAQPRHAARALPRGLLAPAPPAAGPRIPSHLFARAAALGVLALAATLPATGIAPQGESVAQATEPRFAAVTAIADAKPVLPPPPVTLRTSAVRERAAAVVARTERARPEWVAPLGGALLSPFGPRWGRMHEGVDIDATYGAPVRATADGVVTFAATQNGYGYIVRVTHAGGIVTAYAHLSRLLTTVGERVEVGAVIGLAGTTGNAQSPHLHFEVLRGTVPVEPLSFLRQRGVRI